MNPDPHSSLETWSNAKLISSPTNYARHPALLDPGYFAQDMCSTSSETNYTRNVAMRELDQTSISPEALASAKVCARPALRGQSVRSGFSSSAASAPSPVGTTCRCFLFCSPPQVLALPPKCTRAALSFSRSVARSSMRPSFFAQTRLFSFYSIFSAPRAVSYCIAAVTLQMLLISAILLREIMQLMQSKV